MLVRRPRRDRSAAGAGADAGPRRKPAAPRRKRLGVLAAQVGLLVALVGSWQALASTKRIDVFFYGEPSGVWEQLKIWVQIGTSQGPLWSQIWITAQETLIGFAIGVGLGVVCGIVLGRISILAQ